MYLPDLSSGGGGGGGERGLEMRLLSLVIKKKAMLHMLLGVGLVSLVTIRCMQFLPPYSRCITKLGSNALLAGTEVSFNM